MALPWVARMSPSGSMRGFGRPAS
ncbi:MAG: hypothetical protein QOJ19_3160, partial [Acidimicrobiia bacterium]|nr:hypothetical protein [Acidimicrobiia bacterium]